MRIAICYSGQPRDIQHTFSNHQSVLIAPFEREGHEVDICGHIWHDENSNGLFWDKYPDRGRWDNSTKDWIMYNMNPKKIVWEKPRSFDSPHKSDPRFAHPINNILSMFYSIERANDIKTEMEKENGVYDFVFRIRCDLFFRKSIDNLCEHDTSKIHVLNEVSHLDYALNDHFAFSSSEIMDDYCSVYSNFDALCEEGAAVNPECLVGFNILKKHGRECHKHDWNYLLWRDHR